MKTKTSIMPTIKIRLIDSTEYRLNGILHREDGPAVEYPSGTKTWCVYGLKIGYMYGGIWCYNSIEDKRAYLFSKRWFRELITLKSYIKTKVESREI